MALEQAITCNLLVRDENGIRFADAKVLTVHAADYVLRHERDALKASPTACFQRLQALWQHEAGADNPVSGRILSTLHNTDELDAFEAARRAIADGVRVFDVIHVLEAAVPHLAKGNAATIFGLVSACFQLEKSHIPAGSLYATLGNWLPTHPDIAREIIALQERAPDEATSALYCAVLHALAVHDFDSGFEIIIEAAGSGEQYIARPALQALGLVDFAPSARRAALERVINRCAEIIQDQTHPGYAPAVRCAGRLVLHDETRIPALLDHAAQTHGSEVLTEICNVVLADHRAWDRPWFWPLMKHLAWLGEPVHAVHSLDHALSRVLRDGSRVDRVIDFLNSWIAERPGAMLKDPGLSKLFGSTIPRLANVSGALGKAMTIWLLAAEDERFGLAAHDVASAMRVARFTNLGLDKGILDTLSEDELRFLVRRILGYLIGHEVQLALLFSMLATCDAPSRTFGFFSGVVLDLIGYDFPEQTLEFLRGKAQDANLDSAVRELCGVIAERLEEQQAAEEALPFLKEFYPDPYRVRRFARERHLQMAKAMEEANKESIWRQIAAEVRLKAGRRTFQRFQDRYTDIMSLKEISQTIPLPRTEVADPMGSQRQRHLFRRAKKGDK